MPTFTEAQVLTYHVESCFTCGIYFALEGAYYEMKRREKEKSTFCCPNGHQQHYTSESDRDKIARLDREKASIRAQLDQERAAKYAAEAQRDKLKRRIRNGVCPCCKRSFTNLRRHIGTKHPEYAK